MPILLDYSNIFIASVTAFGSDFKKGAPISKMESIARHVFLTSLLGYKKTWGDKCGNIVVCCDGKNNWRKDIFPYYKGLRGKNREESELDWNSIFAIMGDIKMELAMLFPYKVIQEDKAEGDDVIFVLSDYFAANDLIQEGLEESPQKVINISSDHDFLQQHKHKNYAQWSPMTKKVIPKPPKTFLVDKIISGDDGDGVPSVLMFDDFCMDKAKYGRAKPITKKIIDKYSDHANLNEAELARYKRNEVLISSAYVPTDVRDRILAQYKLAPDKANRQGIFDLLVRHQLRQLMPRVTEF